MFFLVFENKPLFGRKNQGDEKLKGAKKNDGASAVGVDPKGTVQPPHHAGYAKQAGKKHHGTQTLAYQKGCCRRADEKTQGHDGSHNENGIDNHHGNKKNQRVVQKSAGQVKDFGGDGVEAK